MAFAEVVGHYEQGDGGAVIGQLAGPAKAKPAKSLGEVADREVAPFNVRGANLVGVRLA